MSPSFDLDGIDTEEIGRLMELLSGSDVEECEIERGEFKLSLRRLVRETQPQEEAASVPTSLEEPGSEEQLVIRAPAVGVFTLADKASSSPGVGVGSRVGAGDVVGHIEVMMIPHSIRSDWEGIVDSLMVEDGQPVEYGQPLMTLRPL